MSLGPTSKAFKSATLAAPAPAAMLSHHDGLLPSGAVGGNTCFLRLS